MQTESVNPIHRKILVAGGAGIVFTGLLWIIWSLVRTPLPWLITVFGLILVGNGLLFIIDRKSRLINLAAALIGMNLLYLGGEVLVWFGVSAGWFRPEYTWPIEEAGVPVFPFFDRPCAAYDSVRGFRWTQPARVVKIADGRLVFDRVIHPNNEGFISNTDFSYAKKDTSTLRLMVLGDSFTDGYFLESNWPDRVNAWWGNQGNLELYSFALNGSGIVNWHSLFFREILPKYEFDGVVIACFGNDLRRDRFVLHHSQDSAWFGWRSEDKKGEWEGLSASALIQKTDVLDERIRRSVPEFRKGFQLHPPALFLLTRALNYYREKAGVERFQSDMFRLYSEDLKMKENPQEWAYNRDAFLRDYGQEKGRMFLDILDSCKAKNKTVILATVPEQFGLRVNYVSTKTLLQMRLGALAKAENTLYFDGYENVRDRVSMDSLWACFLPFDGHWSQKASDLFAQGFIEFLKSNDSLIRKGMMRREDM